MTDTSFYDLLMRFIFTFNILKLILSKGSCLLRRCDVFDTMFHDNSVAIESNDVPYILSDVQPDSFLAVLEFVYTNCCSLSNKNVSNFVEDYIGCILILTTITRFVSRQLKNQTVLNLALHISSVVHINVCMLYHHIYRLWMC